MGFEFVKFSILIISRNVSYLCTLQELQTTVVQAGKSVSQSQLTCGRGRKRICTLNPSGSPRVSSSWSRAAARPSSGIAALSLKRRRKNIYIMVNLVIYLINNTHTYDTSRSSAGLEENGYLIWMYMRPSLLWKQMQS